MANKKSDQIIRLKNIVEEFLEKDISLDKFVDPKNPNAVDDVYRIKNCIFENLIYPGQAEDVFRNIEKKLHLEWDADETVQALLYDTNKYYESEILKKIETRKDWKFKAYIDSNPEFLNEAVDGLIKNTIVNDKKIYYSAFFICQVYRYIRPFWDKFTALVKSSAENSSPVLNFYINDAFEEVFNYQIEFKCGIIKIEEKIESKVKDIARYSFISLLNNMPIDYFSKCDVCKKWFIKNRKNGTHCSGTRRGRKYRQKHKELANERSRISMQKKYQKELKLPVKSRPKTSRNFNQSLPESIERIKKKS